MNQNISHWRHVVIHNFKSTLKFAFLKTCIVPKIKSGGGHAHEAHQQGTFTSELQLLVGSYSAIALYSRGIR
jgi:hypothetical protein